MINMIEVLFVTDFFFRITGDGCAAQQFQCAGSTPECVALISVCDGKSNCVNGADEEVCGEYRRKLSEFWTK